MNTNTYTVLSSRVSLVVLGSLVLLGLIGMAPMAIAEEEAPETLEGLPLVFEEDFESGIARWEMTDPEAWSVKEDAGRQVLSLNELSDYTPPVRSPLNIAYVKEMNVGDFILEAKVRYTGREYGHADLCFFFGGQDPAHFYYAHIAAEADPHANSIFLVNGEPRVSIAEERTDGTDWSEGYHTVRIKRETESGLIEVYFDDMETPIMSTHDDTFTSGTIGVGSFDDTGYFDTIRVYAKPPKE